MNSPAFPSDHGRILLADQDAVFATEIDRSLRQRPEAGFRIAAHATTLEDAVSRLRDGGFDLVLFSLSLPDVDGMDAFRRAREAGAPVPFIVVCRQAEEDLALAAVQMGAHEYLLRESFDASSFQRALRYATDRARAEAALATERDLLQTLLENIPDRIYFKDEKSRFIRINRALTRLFQLSRPEEAYGKTDADFYGPEHAQEALDDELRVMRTGEPMVAKIEKEELAHGGESWSLTTKIPLRDHAGRIVGTCGISREITDLKQMQERLATERNLLRSVIDNLPDLVFLKDTSGRYLFDNAAHLKFVGAADFSEVIGRTVYDFYPEDIAREFHAEDEEVLRSGQPLVNHEERLVTPDGEEHWVLVTKVPWRDESGTVLGLVCISRDITEKKRADENLRRAYSDLARSREQVLGAMAKLRAAHEDLRQMQLQLVEAEKMKTVGRLAAGVAHEVKNPLAILRMGLDFLTEQGVADEVSATVLHEMSEAVQRADNVIRGLLDFSAPTRLELQPADLNAAIRQSVQLAAKEMKNGSVEIVLELAPNLPTVRIDPAKMSQVFVNLLTNAFHAMEERGVLTVRTYSRQLTGVGSNLSDRRTESFRVGETIVIAEIDDTGPGVPEDQLNKVFEPFFTTKPTGKGTGLGLSVVKTLIDLHGGTIDIRNRPNGGARVTVMLSV